MQPISDTYSLVLSITPSSTSEGPSHVVFIDCHALAISEFGAHVSSIALGVVEICHFCTDSFRRYTCLVAYCTLF